MKVELEIYSGQPNPTWVLTHDEVDELNLRLARLLVRPSAGPRGEPLGYRGLRIAAPTVGESITIGAGVVERIGQDGSVRQFDDAGRNLECWLLRTAAGRLDEALRQLGIADIGSGCG
jgi:hypothetical protein